MSLSIMSFISEHPSYTEFVEKCWQQLVMVIISTLCAIIIGIPFAISIRHSTRTKQFVLSVVNVLQTIPSLALLTILVPFVGIGYAPAIIALIIYALLPILQNTITGLETISPQYLETAVCLGCTPRQELLLVEIPLALPIILTGIRMAIIMTAGFATLASFVGAGGLGDFINRGLALNDPALILWGAIPAVIFVLLLDKCFLMLQKKCSSFYLFRLKFNPKIIASISTLTILCIFISFFKAQTHQTEIRVASKNFTEQLILAEIISEILEAQTNYHVVRKFNLGTTAICQQALIKNEIDLYPEYTGTAYMTVLKNSMSSEREKIFKIVKEDYFQKFNLTWLSPFGFENTQRIAVTAEFAKQHHLKTLSDLKFISHKMVLAAPPEFVARPDGASLLEKEYGIHFKRIRALEPGLIYQSILHHRVDAIIAFSTDGKIEENHLVLLEDDQQKTPPYDAAIVVRNQLIEKNPEVQAILEMLSYEIDEQTMREMNDAVERKVKTIAQVAREFLQEKRLLD